MLYPPQKPQHFAAPSFFALSFSSRSVAKMMSRSGQGSDSKAVADDHHSDRQTRGTLRRDETGRHSRVKVATVDVHPAAGQDNNRTRRTDSNRPKRRGGQHAKDREGRGRCPGPKRRHTSPEHRRRGPCRKSRSASPPGRRRHDADDCKKPAICRTCQVRSAIGDVVYLPSCEICYMDLLDKKPKTPPMRRYQFQPGDSATAAGSDAASSTQTPQVATALTVAERQAKCKRYAKQGVTVVLPDSGSDHSAAHEAEVATVTLKGMMAQHKYDHPKAKQGR